MRAGALMAAVGAVLDLLAHVAPGAWTAPGGAERAAHTVVFVGMALCLAGLWSRRSGGDRDAVR